MTTSLKFNRKVYVVPEEKYLRMKESEKDRNRDDRTAVADVRHESDTPVLREDSSKNSYAVREKSESSRVEPLVPEKNNVFRDSKKYLKEVTSKLTSKLDKNRAKALVYNLVSCLTTEQYGKLTAKREDFTKSLLHTQSDDYPPSKDDKLFYTAILENDIPLRLIGNTKLRRALHYMKNKSYSNNVTPKDARKMVKRSNVPRKIPPRHTPRVGNRGSKTRNDFNLEGPINSKESTRNKNVTNKWIKI